MMTAAAAMKTKEVYNRGFFGLSDCLIIHGCLRMPSCTHTPALDVRLRLHGNFHNMKRCRLSWWLDREHCQTRSLASSSCPTTLTIVDDSQPMRTRRQRRRRATGPGINLERIEFNLLLTLAVGNDDKRHPKRAGPRWIKPFLVLYC